MPMFTVVQRAEMSPTQCRMCGDFTGPFIDTGIDEIVYGHVYLCGPTADRVGCVGQMAHAFGWASPGEVSALQAEIVTLADRLAQKKIKDKTLKKLEELIA